MNNKKITISAATDNMVKTSVQKSNLVLQYIRGQNAIKSMDSLEFCKKSVARPIRKILGAAISNAQNNFEMNIDSLYISEARVGKSVTLKRTSIRAKGRANRICKPYTRITIILKEKEGTI
jgi:large subunit ribosomal protein L22